MASAFDAIAAVAVLLNKSGLAEELKAYLDGRRSDGTNLKDKIDALPIPQPPKKGTDNG